VPVQFTNDDIRSLVYETCQALDDENYDKYLSLCAPDYQYQITTYSPEIRKEQTWLKHDRNEMVGLFKMLPQHVRMPGRFFRQACVGSIGDLTNTEAVNITSSLLVAYTEPEGLSRLFAVGRYEDKIAANGKSPVLLSRTVRLDTRDLSPGAHVPL